MSIETAKMSERGQVIIPKDIREAIGANETTIFAVSTIDNETVVMKKINTKLLSEQFTKLRANAKKLTNKEIEEEINAARKR